MLGFKLNTGLCNCGKKEDKKKKKKINGESIRERVILRANRAKGREEVTMFKYFGNFPRQRSDGKTERRCFSPSGRDE
jgi:hypothetical protein